VRALFFGTYDETTHPRVSVLREGLEAHGFDIEVCNEPLGVDTAARVDLARRPWTAPVLLWRILATWRRLWRRARELEPPDLVIVGYLGQFDVHLARGLFRCPIALDFMVALGDTSRDRGIREWTLVPIALDLVDRLALRAADIVVVDTEEQASQLAGRPARRAVVVPVGAPEPWFSAVPGDGASSDALLRVVFFGLYTPLQGGRTIGEAIARTAHDERIQWTMIGRGQDRASTEEIAACNDQVTWIDWVDSTELPRVVARHDVCLGIFGESAKARRVVPNKVFQGCAAGCAVVTSSTTPQVGALGDAALYVDPGDGPALADLIVRLADDRSLLLAARRRSRALAEGSFRPAAIVEPLIDAVVAR
jgi:glycosyltransferase involved in cell wall biosynthesis